MEEQYHFFYQARDVFSQWHPSRFEINQIVFSNAEQAMMYYKAKLFKDEHSAKLILETTDPSTIKRLGRQVKNFNESTWKSHRERIVTQINLAKFSQNPSLQTALLSTGDKILVEASPYDKIWGIGYAKKDAMSNVDKWGLNLLGKCLMKVRQQLMDDG